MQSRNLIGKLNHMNNRIFYFAYGSNMAVQRLCSRVPSAEFVCVAELNGYALKFHKPSKKDGSGKCDAAYTGVAEDRTYGALYSIFESDLSALDKFEGRGYGYERETLVLRKSDGEEVRAEIYIATENNPSLRPFDWYKEHVIRGAKSINLPLTYIALIEAIEFEVDLNSDRRERELAIYN